MQCGAALKMLIGSKRMTPHISVGVSRILRSTCGKVYSAAHGSFGRVQGVNHCNIMCRTQNDTIAQSGFDRRERIRGQAKGIQNSGRGLEGWKQWP